jgi:RNA recognition motif-containing protein
MKLLIRNLDRSTTEADLRKLFEAYGAVQYCTLVLDKRTGISKGFAFVEMPKSGEARAAMKNLNATVVDGKTIRVKKAESKQAQAQPPAP